MWKLYFWNLVISIDQFLNSLLGGDPDMTLSGRMGRAIKAGKCKLCGPVCWLLAKLDSDHCMSSDANEADEGKDQVAPFKHVK